MYRGNTTVCRVHELGESIINPYSGTKYETDKRSVIVILFWPDCTPEPENKYIYIYIWICVLRSVWRPHFIYISEGRLRGQNHSCPVKAMQKKVESTFTRKTYCWGLQSCLFFSIGLYKKHKQSNTLGRIQLSNGATVCEVVEPIGFVVVRDQ